MKILEIYIYFENLTLCRHFLMTLVIAAKQKFEEHLSVTVSVKNFLISMAKIFLFPKLLQKTTHLQFFLSWDVFGKIIVPVMSSFY